MDMPHRYRLPLCQPVPSLKGAAFLRLSSIITFNPDVFFEGALGLPMSALFEKEGLGDEFKTIAKAARGKIRPTQTTVRTLERKLGRKVEPLAEGNPLPWAAMQRAWGMPAEWPESRFVSAMAKAEAASEDAVEAALLSVNDFWGSVGIGAYAACVDTCILAARCAGLPLTAIEPFLSEKAGPFAHLIDELGRMVESKNMASTSRALAARGVLVPDGLLRKWSAGVQLPRRSQVGAICRALPPVYQQQFELSYGIARALTFFIGVLSAAPDEAVAGLDVQAMLLRRWEALYSSPSSP